MPPYDWIFASYCVRTGQPIKTSHTGPHGAQTHVVALLLQPLRVAVKDVDVRRAAVRTTGETLPLKRAAAAATNPAHSLHVHMLE